MSRIAHEVSRRMTPRYAKERAREMARERMGRARDRAVESSWFAPLLGAGIGAFVAKALQSRAQERGWDGDGRHQDDRGGRAPWEVEGRPYGYARSGMYAPYEHDDYRGDAARDEGLHGAAEGQGAVSGIREKASEATAQAGEKLSAIAEGARQRAGEVKGRLQEATSSMRERLPDRGQIRASTREDTGLWALGAVALGALFGFALPETDREREMLEPARRKARELGEEARDRVLEKGTEMMDQATGKVRSAGGDPGQQGEPGAAVTPTGPAPLH